MNLTLDWLEVIWTLSALAALLVALANLADAIQDRRVVRRRHLNGMLHTLTRSAVLEEVTRVAKAVALIVAGLASLYVPNTASVTTTHYFEAAVLIRASLVAVNLLILVTGVQVRVLRHQLLSRHPTDAAVRSLTRESDPPHRRRSQEGMSDRTE